MWFFYIPINILQFSYKLILSILVGMASHAQSSHNNKVAKCSTYLKNGHVCWLSYVVGIIFFMCQSKTITNDYFYLKNKGREWGSSNNVLLFLLVELLILILFTYFEMIVPGYYIFAF